MRKIFFIILFCTLISPHFSFSQNNAIIENIFIKKDGIATEHKIQVEYPFYNQARIRSIQFEILNSEGKNPVLKISGRIENMLKRKLNNAEMTVELFNADGSSVEILQQKIMPRSIERGKRFGNFFVETNYSEGISSCKIDIIWPGKN